MRLDLGMLRALSWANASRKSSQRAEKILLRLSLPRDFSFFLEKLQKSSKSYKYFATYFFFLFFSRLQIQT